ncbi:MAG: ABC transporter permease [Candidatus Eremiobacterota bacterium]
MLEGFLFSTLRLATPYLYAALGETLGQRSGVLNLGLEGVMLMGAFTSFLTLVRTGSLTLAVLAALATGLALGLLLALVSVTFRGEQGIAGIGLTMLGLGLSALLYRMTVGNVETVEGFPALHPPLGPVLSGHHLLTYLAFLLVPAMAWLIGSTRFGLEVRAVGQNPQAADALGISVERTRCLCLAVGGMLGGLAGASLSIANLNLFQEGMTNGIGFIAVALVYFGGWSPWGVLLGVLLFSGVNALQLWIQVARLPIPPDLAVMLPYLLTIAVMAASGRRTREPAALGRPFER